MKENKCKRCDHQWKSNLEKPKVCPKCKSYYWDKPIKIEGICPSCGSDELVKEWMVDEGEDIQIKKCRSCDWYGGIE